MGHYSAVKIHVACYSYYHFIFIEFLCSFFHNFINFESNYFSHIAYYLEINLYVDSQVDCFFIFSSL